MIYTSFKAEFNGEQLLKKRYIVKCVATGLGEKNVLHIPAYRKK